jgi:hypothetical protein
VLRSILARRSEKGMRFVDIKFSQRSAQPGGSISGVVVVHADECFNCNRIILKVRGRERTEMGSGDTRITDEVLHADGEILLCDAYEVQQGKSEFPFKFWLDEGLPPTYSGYYGWIEYTVEAIVEVNWALDPRMKRQFRVLPVHPAYIPEIDGYNPKNKDNDELHVELPSEVLRINRGIPVRFMVDQHSRVNGVRIEIRKREYATCQGSDRTNDTTTKMEFIPIEDSGFDRWIEVAMGEGWHHVPFKSRLLATSFYLKVVLEMRWELDPEVKYQLDVSGEKPGEEVEEILNSTTFDLGFN